MTLWTRIATIPALSAWRSGGLKLFRDFAALASGQLVSKVIGFFAFALLARILEPEGYGAVEYVVGLGAFFAFVVDGGVGPVGARRVIRDPGQLPRLAFQIPVARLMIATVGVPAMVLFALASMGPGAPTGLIWLFAVSLLFMPWRQEWLFQATERMRDAAIMQVIQAGVFAFAVLTLVRSPDDLVVVGVAEVAAVAATTAYCLWVQQTRIVPLRLGGSLQGFGALLKEGGALSMTNLVWAAAQYAPLFIVQAMVGGASVAWFAAASRVISSLGTFGNLYHFNLYPAVVRAAGEGPDALERLMRRSFRVVAWGGTAMALGITLFAEPITRLAFGPKMGPAALLLQVMSWLLPIAMCSGHARWGLVARGAQGRVLWSQVVGLVVLCVATPVLGRKFGDLGFATGALIGPVAVWATAHLFAARAGAQPPPPHLIVRPLMLAALAFALQQVVGIGLLGDAIGMAVFLAAAPLLDRKLIPDLALLGRAKLAADRGSGQTAEGA